MNSRNNIKIQRSVKFVRKRLKKNMQKIKNIKIIKKLEIIVIIQVNIEVIHVVYVI